MKNKFLFCPKQGDFFDTLLPFTHPFFVLIQNFRLSLFLLFLSLSLLSNGFAAQSPTVTITNEDPSQVNIGAVEINANAFDPEGLAISFEWSFISMPAALNGTPPAIVQEVTGPTSSRARFQITIEGQYILQVKADDLDGNSSTFGTDTIVLNAVFSQLFFVSNTGDDNTSIIEISESKPLKTIQKALDYSGPGDTIILLPDSVQSPAPTTFFSATSSFPTSGTTENPILLKGQVEGLITIRPDGSNQALQVDHKSHINIENLKFMNFSDTAIVLTSASQITISNCVFEKNGSGVGLRKSQNTTLSANEFNLNVTGVKITNTTSARILLSTFFKNSHFGIFQDPVAGSPALNNRMAFNTFYGNGTVFDENTKHGAINLGFNSASIVEFNIFENNIRDYYHPPGLFQDKVNENLSYLNVGIQADDTLFGTNDIKVWPIQDPLFIDPENRDFRLIEGSVAIGAAGSGVNYGSYQGSSMARPTTKTIYVDYDVGKNLFVQTGQSGAPYDSINKALLEAGPGDQIYVKASLDKAYNVNFANLKTKVPGWGTVKLIGQPITVNEDRYVLPALACFQIGEDVVSFDQSSFISLDQFEITGYIANNANSCQRGIRIQNSRHLTLERMSFHGLNQAAVSVDSSEAIVVRSSVIYANSLGLELTTGDHRNQYNLFDKLSIVDNLNTISMQNTYHTSLSNSILYNNFNSDCITFNQINPPTEFKVFYNYCDIVGSAGQFLTATNTGNEVGTGVAKDPLFISENRTVQKTNPFYAFRLKATGTQESPYLNAGDPKYNPLLVLGEFPLPLSVNLSSDTAKTSTGNIDMGAFEQSRTDVDGDGLNNLVDNTFGLDPNDPKDATKDFDGDKLTNIDELITYQTLINNADTDGDGFDDGTEVAIGSDPTVANAEEIQALVPKPIILPHETSITPAQFELTGLETSGKSVTNQWILISGPTGVTTAEIFISQDLDSLKLQVRKAGQYVIGLDQQLISQTTNGATLRSLEADRAITTITVNDVAPTPVVPPDISIQYSPGRIIYFYGDPSISENPSFDANGDPVLSYFWIIESPLGVEATIIDRTNPTPFFVIPDQTAVYQFRLKVISQGINGTKETISKPFRVNVQGSQVSLPRADAGTDLSVPTKQLISLSGAGSGDRDNGTLSYFWRQVEGPEISFIESTACPLNRFEPAAIATATTTCTSGVAPQFVANFAGVAEVELVVRKTVGLDDFLSEPDRVSIQIDDPDNAVPNAVISASNSLTVSQVILLDASSSSDRVSLNGNSSGTNLTYLWTQIAGPPTRIENANTKTIRLIPIEVGFYEFGLKVRDQDGTLSRMAIHKLRVEGENFFLPTANPGTNQAGLIRRTILLDGSSSLGGSDSLQNYFWKQVRGPEEVLIQNANTSAISFVPSKAGLYEFELRVGTKSYLSPSKSVSVAINSDEQAVPVAVAGQNQTTISSSVITLDGSFSFDQDGDPLSFLWQQVSGPLVVLANPTSSITTFFAREVGVYEFSLVVNDGKTNSPISQTLIAVNENDGSVPTQNQAATKFNPTTILGASPKGGCFIVTASFGVDSYPVRFFTGFRDLLLLKIPGGSALMEFYYRYSPPLARQIHDSFLLKQLSRSLLFLLMGIMGALPLFLTIWLILGIFRGLKNYE